MNNQETDCSIIIPVYYNETTLTALFSTLHDKVIVPNPRLRFEVIFIDDGSRDGSFPVLLNLREQHPGLVRIIRFTRNFGQVAALFAGYRHARGKCMVNLSADLQDPPELINEMLAAHLDPSDPREVVICAREGRDESAYRTGTSLVFYRLMRALTFRNMPPGGFDYVLISRKAMESGITPGETNPFWQGQILWSGYEPRIIGYRRRKRESGRSRWSFGKKVKYLIDGIMSYSYFPIRLMTIMGTSIALAGFIYAIFIVFAKIVGDVPFKGWAPIMVLILVLSGIQMLMLGIIGEYLWRTLDQVRGRPPYIIEKIVE